MNLKQYLSEDKSSLIKKSPILTDEQKDEVIEYFKTHTAQESEIDWNKIKTLQYSDFKKVMDKVSKTAKKAAVKSSGISGLKEGKDYIEVNTGNQEVKGYIPLEHDASKLIASPNVGCSVEGKWCVAMNDPQWWNTYSDRGQTLFYFITGDTKYAVVLDSNNTVSECRNSKNESMTAPQINKTLGINLEEIFAKNKAKIEQARKIIIGDAFTFNGKIYRYKKEGDTLVFGSMDISNSGIKSLTELPWVSKVVESIKNAYISFRDYLKA